MGSSCRQAAKKPINAALSQIPIRPAFMMVCGLKAKFGYAFQWCQVGDLTPLLAVATTYCIGNRI